MLRASRNYVGVSGVASVDEAKSVAALALRSGFSLSSGHVPMIGLQASYKSLQYGFSEGNRRVPHLDQLAPILEAAKRDTLPTIHYYTKEPEKLVWQVTALLRHDGIYKRDLIKVLQVNGVWPTHTQLWELRNRFHGLMVTFQMSGKVTAGMSSLEVARRLAGEYPEVDYVLLDSSRGTGKEFGTDEVVSTCREFRNAGVKSRIVIAGGFTGENVVEKVSGLKAALHGSDFSIDAEDGLRDKLGEGYGNDTLNLEKVRAYLEGASSVFLRRKG
ncbi:MAG: hypothetical protein KGI04_00405 [Candidatus Micrarchaeota archaeon]|nr:hypothetical protein [Candidatus Micrarchaeota archaeon]